MSAAQFKVLPGAGHVPHVTNPSEWIALVRAFLGAAAS
jgi:pimeloyl-ACP methyl ester carboxylesterase